MNTDIPVMKLLNMDFPDPDVIRVGEWYYMISTTMHFMPGGQILKSRDLCNWEHASYAFDSLDETQDRRLVLNGHIYGKGMWAACLRFYEGIFYVVFVANDTHKTYLYTSERIEGPWEYHEIEGFYHDCSLLFYEGRKFIVYGNTEIYLTELKDDLSGPKEGGLHRLIVKETDDVMLGYEGAHIYLIRGKIYLFLIHWPKSGAGIRTQACFVADSPDGEFVGKDIYSVTGNFRNAGIAQGGIVDTPKGDWYAVLFQDSGAVGRIPVLVPMEFLDGFPVLDKETEADFGLYNNACMMRSQRNLCFSDSFAYESDEKLDPRWQFNHMPDSSLYSLTDAPGYLSVCTGKITSSPNLAVNTLTQRMCYPSCFASVTVEAKDLNIGDYIGIMALQGCFGFIGITRKEDGFYLETLKRETADPVLGSADETTGICCMESICMKDCTGIELGISVSFAEGDILRLYYKKEDWCQVGDELPLSFKLDHFCGARFGLVCFSTLQAGGTGRFKNFTYRMDDKIN